MEHRLLHYKGIHPGAVIARELKRQGIKQRPLAIKVDEHPQTLHAIISGKRNLNVGLALKIEEALNLEEGTLVLLQAYYEIEKVKKIQKKKPEISAFSSSLFWDTDINTIDWDKHAVSVINRIYERGNEKDKVIARNFYGDDKIEEALKAVRSGHMTIKSNK